MRCAARVSHSLIAAESSAVYPPTLARERLRSPQKVWPRVSIMGAYFFHPSGAGCSEGEVRARWDPGCFRYLLLLICMNIDLKSALVPVFLQTGTCKAKLGRNVLS